MRAILSADQSTITLRGPRWAGAFPADDLQKWLRFYRGLRDRGAPKDKRGAVTGQGPYAAYYSPTVTALERVAKMLDVLQGGARK